MKWIGAILIVGACGGCGMMMASNDRKQERCLRQLQQMFVWIECELSSRMWPIPVLLRQVAEQTDGMLSRIFRDLAEELDKHAAPDARGCMEAVLERHPSLPAKCRLLLSDFGKSLGRYDLDGQLREIVNLQQQAQCLIEEHSAGRDDRLRCYQTLGFCAGVGLAIFLL